MEDHDRVRENTVESVNEELDREALARIQAFESAPAGRITARIDELDREWDTERMLETNASVFGFAGLALGLLVNPYFLLVPVVVLPFLFQHAVQGWCPPMPIFRRMGYRTRNEIDREKYALKALRGDFASADASAEQAARAVSR